MRNPPSPWLLLVASVVAATSQPRAQTDTSLRAAPSSHVSAVTSEAGRFGSPAIALNPANPEQLVVAYAPSGRSSASFDGGQRWVEMPETAGPTGYRSFIDTSVTYDHNGHAIVSFVGTDGAGMFKYWGRNPRRNAVMVRRSLDGGRTWESQTIPVFAHQDAPGIPFEDLPSIVSDVRSGSPHKGNLYVMWTQDRLQDSRILVSRSTDGGLTWAEPLAVNDTPGRPRDDNGIVAGVRGVVTADGALHVVWTNGRNVVYTVSRDGGKTFSRNAAIVDVTASHFPALNVAEVNGYPQIDTSGTGSTLFVSWADFRNGDVDVFCLSSPDGGRTWSAPARVNNDPLHNGADQLYPSLSVDPTSGAVNVMFYDRRHDAQNRGVQVVLARSLDGGRTFENYLMSDRSFDPNGGALGEYTALASRGGRVYGAWLETGGGSAPAPGEAVRERRTVVRVGVADFN